MHDGTLQEWRTEAMTADGTPGTAELQLGSSRAPVEKTFLDITYGMPYVIDGGEHDDDLRH